MLAMKKISIVTVAYNAVESIEETIQSILSQNYSDYEYIVIDGGSTDGTTAIIGRYSSNIDYYVSEPDRGIYDAMNKAIDVASGEWIIFLNSGDKFVDADVLHRVSAYMSSNTEASVVFGNTINKYPWGSFKSEGSHLSLNDVCLPFCHQSVFVKTNLMQQYKFDLSYKIVADYGFFYKLHLEGLRFLHIDELISVYDMSGFSSQRVVESYKEIARINGTYKSLIYYKKITFLYISQLAKKILPASWTQKIRERRRLSEPINRKSSQSAIIVNSTATRSSGALSILKQFVQNIPNNFDSVYYIFIDPSVSFSLDSDNIKFIHKDTANWGKRVLWDAFGIKRWLKKNKITPSLIISLQNTGVNYSHSVPQLVYFHHPFPLSDYSWNIFKREELSISIFKQIYSFFVSLYKHSRTHFVVQIPSLKESFLKKYAVGEERVHVISPEISKIDYHSCPKVQLEKGLTHFIYPATPLVYKNHLVLLQALLTLKKEDVHLFNNIRIHFTVQEEYLLKFPEYSEVSKSIVCEGVMPFDRLIGCYNSMDALLFPSFIETFGLPLLEAAGAGLPIIASDLPYVHDVVGEYSGVTYADYKDGSSWADKMREICNVKRRFESFQYPESRANWTTFFELVEQLRLE